MGTQKKPPATYKQRDTELITASQAVIHEAIEHHPDDIRGQLTYFFQNFSLPSARGRDRTLSQATRRKYVITMMVFVNFLSSKRINITNIKAFTFRHFLLAIQHWEDSGRSNSLLANYYAIIKRYYFLAEIPFLSTSVSDVLKNKERGKRSFSTTKSLSIDYSNFSEESIIASFDKEDIYAGAIVRLIFAFGLRAREAVNFKPSVNDFGTYISITSGAKGGLHRTIPIDDEKQREYLDYAISKENKQSHLLRKNGYTTQMVVRRLEYLAEKLGLTKSASGYTLHSLRHTYAQRQYQKMTGQQAPVNGGKRVDPKIDSQARQEISRALGHGRKYITSAYIGSHRQMSKIQAKRLHDLNAALAYHPKLSQLAKLCAEEFAQTLSTPAPPAIEVRLFVLGPEATGAEPSTYGLDTAVGLYDSHNQRLPGQVDLKWLIQFTTTLAEALGRLARCVDISSVPENAERLEIFLD